MNYKQNYENYVNYIKQEIQKGNRPKNKKEWKKWKRNGDNRYFEFHHIIPKCAGGNESEENYIPLTGREHFLAGYLLCKIYEQNKEHYYQMLCAFKRQCINKNGLIYMNGKLYEKLRIEHQKIIKERMKGNIYGFKKGQSIILSKDSIEKRSKQLRGQKRTEEQKQYIKEKTILAMQRKEVKEKLGSGNRGKQTWNKGLKATTKNLYWFNNGIKNIRREICPEGFLPGRVNIDI